MVDGVVLWYNLDKGFGVIQVDGRPNVFVHHSNLKAKCLKKGDKVTLDLYECDKVIGRLTAKNVILKG